MLDKLATAHHARLVAIVAPPGFGKTTVMAQWMESESRPAAWLTIDRLDNDPAVLIGDIYAALTSAGMLSRPRRQRTTSEIVLTHGVTSLIEDLERHRVTGTLFLDQVDRLRNRSSLDVLGSLITQVPDAFKVAIATRSGAGLPFPILRSQGALMEISHLDLAMEETEAKELLDGAGVSIETDFGHILERTEGWPAGLYLTALAMQAGADASSLPEVRGDDVFVADYMRHEVLGRLSAERRSFLTRTSILSRLSGPLCDFVLETSGSARRLERLEGSNLLITPMDRTRTWYRYHSLLRDFLRSELERSEFEAPTSLHSRAASWLKEHGEPEMAIEHAIEAGESDHVASMVADVARSTYAQGRMDTLSRWLTWLEDDGTMSNTPGLAAIGSFARSLEGDERGAERLAGHAFVGADGEALPEDSLVPISLVVRSFRADHGVEAALTDARLALASMSRSADWLHVAMGAEAMALTALGERDEAERLWGTAVGIGDELQALPFTTTGLAQAALIASERGDWAGAEELVQRSMRRIDDGGLELYITSALTFVLAARLDIRRGDILAARAHMGQATAIRPRLGIALPTFSLQVMVEMAKTFIELADIAGARRVMRDAATLVFARPRLGVLSDEYEATKEKLSALPAGSVGPSSLTTAELRLLTMLVTHLTFPEIGDRLYVSRHTVKTQAMSIYRKLGVSSRTEAVETARALGLLSS
ncbi:MAG: LuxR C-terminal-related transcriptional regulator [Acidimicrobiia bacterium]